MKLFYTHAAFMENAKKRGVTVAPTNEYMLINASEIIEAITPEKLVEIPLGLFAPPAEHLWIEFESRPTDITPFYQTHAIGVHVEEIDDEIKKRDCVLPDARWLCSWIALVKTPMFPAIAVMNSIGRVNVDNEGKIIAHNRAPKDIKHPPMVDYLLLNAMPDEHQRFYSERYFVLNDDPFVNGAGGYFLRVLAHLHAGYEANRVYPSRQQTRRLERKAGLKALPYYMLSVKGSKRGPSPESTNTPSERKYAEHTVRGHFKYYHPDRPHVSGLTGFMWVDQFTRGDKEEGEIKKGYRLKTDD